MNSIVEDEKKGAFPKWDTIQYTVLIASAKQPAYMSTHSRKIKYKITYNIIRITTYI